MDWLVIGFLAGMFGWWFGFMTTRYPSEQEMFNRIVEVRVERESRKRHRETLETEITEAVDKELAS